MSHTEDRMANELAPVDQAKLVLQQHQSDMVYVRQEDLDTQSMFRPVVTVVKSTPDDFHEIKGGNLMPKSHQVDRMGEASGVTFVAEHCRVDKVDRYVWVGRAQGKRRMPDGTWRHSAVHEYEYDAELRSEETAMNDTKGRYKTDMAKRRLLLETAKFGRQRAATGARLKVIRELVGVPTAFSRGQIQEGRAFVFARIDVNSDAMLENPELRRAAIEHATGAASSMYGPSERGEPLRISAPDNEVLGSEAERVPTDESDAFDDLDEPEGDNSSDERAVMRRELEEWVLSDELPAKGVRLIKEALGNPDTPIETLKDLLERARTAANAKGRN
jgi:hypothetical protein